MLLRPAAARLVKNSMLGLRAESDELLTLDSLRFFASLAIVAHHYKGFAAEGLGLLPLMDRFDFLTIFVDLFFTVSGFIIAYVYAGRITNGQSYFEFLRRRIARLGPLHWVTLAAYVLLGLTVANPGGIYKWECLPANAALIHAWGTCSGLSFNGVSWSISAEIAMYLAFPLLLLLVRLKPIASLASVPVILLLLTFTTGGAWIDALTAIRAVPSFLMGIVIWHFRPKIPVPSIILVAALASLSAIGFLMVPKVALLPLVYLAVCAAVSLDISGKRGRIVTSTAPLGQLSFSIYMLHPLAQTLLVVGLGERILHLKGWLRLPWIIAVACVVVFGSLLSLRYFETPARRWLSPSRRNHPETDPLTPLPAGKGRLIEEV